MSLGDLPLGEGLLGEPIATAPITPSPTRPRALQFDPQTRDHVMDANGRYVDIHPVDAGVVSSMMFAQGRIVSAPTVGQTLAQAEGGNSLTKDVENRVRLAVAWLVNRGDIEIVAIRVDQTSGKAFEVELDYYNLRLPMPRKKQTVAGTTGA